MNYRWSKAVLPNFAEHIGKQVAEHENRKSYVFIQGNPGDPGGETRLGYRDLDRRACAIAAWLAVQKAATAPVLLAYAEGLGFLSAFIACLYAGVIAVPVPLPGDARSIERTRRILHDAGIRLVLTETPAQAASLAQMLDDSGAAAAPRCMATETIEPDVSRGWRVATTGPESIAYLQYTSGSTGDPKGVIVSHRNIMHNESMIQRAIASHAGSVVAGWLPHFHDMGLIGLLLHPLYVGCDCVFMAPSTFLRRPVRWLDAMTRYAATITVAPNFAYELCTRAVRDEQLAGLDLSTLDVALNGAEPVRVGTLEGFVERFAPVGFRAAAFAPCYGMAESTLLATATPAAAAPTLLDLDGSALEHHVAEPARAGEAPLRVAGSGRADLLDLRIVEPASRTVLEDGRVGEIWLRGDSVAQGYWGRPEVSAATFRAETAAGEGPYLRTGDLGFVRDGELFVTGRIKDLLIVNGRNLYPQDIENFVGDLHSALSVGAGAVFSVDADGEHVVVVHELKEALATGSLPPDAFPAYIRASVAREFNIAAPSVVLVPRGDVRRTTSGKVRRALMRDLFLANQLHALHEEIQTPVRRARTRAAGSSSWRGDV